jgi:hypothetical protein
MNKKVICKCKQYKKQIEELKTIVQDLKAQYNVSNTQHVNSIKDLIKDEPTREPLQKQCKPNVLHPIDHDLILKDNAKWVEPLYNKETVTFPEHNICNTKFDPESFNKQFEQHVKVDMTDVLFVTDPLNPRNNNEPYNPNLLPIKEVSGREKFDLDEFNRQFEKLN